MRDMIQEIGVRENRIAKTEYPIDGYRFDVIWKRIAAGTPSHVFEVQIEGNLELALTKLKHAWDKWNSFPTTDEDAPRAQSLLEGSFHEMGYIARIVDWGAKDSPSAIAGLARHTQDRICKRLGLLMVRLNRDLVGS